ncbi:glycosyltransferase [Paeniglutamicibacter sp. ABSL32-1]|uniref:glycosyltransferase family 2 protein n=1 Tax=Paeniglutamicibacter quisquiliarum TaxID=2849498 RepID=UPI001C2DB66D|nr:glycosyltransferase family 2 protein [Paeniglutamicibacter quisquiliarum]MBV1780707.1 glycosyltransferase [Paeniglutamicibacter quisquiliarum]
MDQEQLPLISVVMATRNRAGLLKQSMHSVLNQTFRNLELVVVDDGSTDDTRDVVESVIDSRVKYVRGHGRGISAARNTGADHSRGLWTAVHDDDDIMLPTRLEEQLKYADDSVDFIYGAFINFDDASGKLQLHHGRNYGFGPALMTGFAPGHSTWLVRTDLIRKFRYDEGIESAVDNNLTFRMLRSGVRFKHSGVICLLRRVHSGRITDQGGKGQKYVAQMNLAFIKRGFSEDEIDTLSKEARRDWGAVDKKKWETKFLGFIPDHLVKRSGFLLSTNYVEDQLGTLQRLALDDASAMDWFDFVQRCGSGASQDNVTVRVRERPEIESLLQGIELEPKIRRKDNRTLLTEFALGWLDSNPEDNFGTSPYIALVIGESRMWTDQQKKLAVNRFVTGRGRDEFMAGIIEFNSLEAAVRLNAVIFTASDFDYRILASGGIDAVQDRVSMELVPGTDSKSV